MNIPGFTAEASLFTTRRYNLQGRRQSGEVRNQGIISQWVWTGVVTPFEREPSGPNPALHARRGSMPRAGEILVHC